MNVGDYGGFIKLFRSMRKKPWYKDSQAVHLWVELLFESTYTNQEKEAFFGADIIKLQPGQVITGRQELAKNLKIDQHKVDRLLKMWATVDQQIEQVTTSRGRLISILNWDRYNPLSNEVSNKHTTSEQQVSTILRRKEEDKEKEILKEKEKSELPRQLPTTPPTLSDEKLSQILNLSKQLLNIFEEARLFYPGAKRGLETELRYFLRCHKKESKDIIPFLLPAIQSQIAERKEKKKRGVFVPEWKHFKTWVYNRWWESEI